MRSGVTDGQSGLEGLSTALEAPKGNFISGHRSWSHGGQIGSLRRPGLEILMRITPSTRDDPGAPTEIAYQGL